MTTVIVLFHDRFVDRKECLIDIEDRANQFGDGVYEVIRVYDGEFFLFDDHLKRLEYSLNEAKIKYDINHQQLKELLLELLKKNEVNNGGIYIQISRGIAARSHPFPKESKPTVIAYPIPTSRPLDKQENGIQATLYQDIRWHRCDIKSLNLLGNVMAKQHALDIGASEAIFYRDYNHVTEGSSTNVFIVNDGVIQTHPANNFILNGITRLYIKYLAKQLDLPFNEKVFTVAELKEADEVFISSTTSEVIPVTQIDETVIGNGKPGPIAKQLLNAFFEHHKIQQLTK
ncbi:D-amino-acid transaminase [Filobacillus milosensis]|uniref:D-alanine aminotransferase n=1 Tax=Filobacillus milosensis TaxID=94137 RepID=A0A4Y8ISZ1_9BACI|nr:D-amino-acid transaminase [Filobacillus milosensis]TFB22042.1 D-amino-acid transaminase [Filobacillus milosensis]